MGYIGRNMASTNVDMGGLKFSPLGRFQDKGLQPQVYEDCLHNCWQAIQSIGQYLSTPIPHLYGLPEHLGDPWLASQP